MSIETISIKHVGYMMTIAEVILAIEDATGAKVVSIKDTTDTLTFVLEYPEPETSYSPDPEIVEFWDEYAQEKDDEG